MFLLRSTCPGEANACEFMTISPMATTNNYSKVFKSENVALKWLPSLLRGMWTVKGNIFTLKHLRVVVSCYHWRYCHESTSIRLCWTGCTKQEHDMRSWHQTTPADIIELIGLWMAKIISNKTNAYFISINLFYSCLFMDFNN